MSSRICPRRPVEERFWSKVAIDGDAASCWMWMAGKMRGYGQFWVGDLSQNVRAHRWAFEYVIGAIPDGMTIDHLCRQTSCVNPFHLEPVTFAENNRRAAPFSVQTHCHAGHAFDANNTYVSPEGKRFCRPCKATRERLRKRAIRSAQN